MSWFGVKSEAANVQNFYPVTTYKSGYGALSDDDTKWECSTHRGFQTETQTWYTVIADGSVIMCQVIWSCLGVRFIPSTTQFTFKYFNPTTGQHTWKSVNGSNFKTNGQSCKADQFEIQHTGTAGSEEVYKITGSLDKHVQLAVSFTRPSSAPGVKYGEGADGGYSTFGTSTEDGQRDGFAIHRFHPLVHSAGSIIIDGKVVDVEGNGCFIHAIQGMRPDSLASRWNFAFFTSGGGKADGKLGEVRAIQMEFTTTDSYGPKGPKSGRTTVNLGAVYLTTKSPVPIITVGQTTVASDATYPTSADTKDTSSAKHLTTVQDTETGYLAPTAIEFVWSGPARDGSGTITAKVAREGLGVKAGEGGLIEKVDVLAEIPYVIRKGLAAVTGTKPYVFQYHNPAVLHVEVDGETVDVDGWLFNEASFVSE